MYGAGTELRGSGTGGRDGDDSRLVTFMERRARWTAA